VEDAATEGPEVRGSAIGVGAADAGHALVIVAAVQKALHRLGDPLEAELPESLGELSLIAGDELGEVGTEEPLEGARSPLAVGAEGRRIQEERQLVCHMKKDGPEERGAFTPAYPCREPPAPRGGRISGYT